MDKIAELKLASREDTRAMLIALEEIQRKINELVRAVNDLIDQQPS